MSQILKTIVAVKTLKGTSFVGVRNYRNQANELSNQTFLVGINYTNLLKNDLEKLKAFDLSTLAGVYPQPILEKALEELIKSNETLLLSETEKDKLRVEGNDTLKRSDAMYDAFVPLATGLKTKDGALYITGLAVKKTVLEKGEYKTVNSRDLTLAKERIKKDANLASLKYRSFKLGSLEELKIQGLTIQQ